MHGVDGCVFRRTGCRCDAPHVHAPLRVAFTALEALPHMSGVCCVLMGCAALPRMSGVCTWGVR